jgi:hypothetical protein
VKMLKLFVSIIAGAVLGILGSRYLFVGSWLSLIPWALVGLALGYWSWKRVALINGAVYGFVLSFVFMAAGYSGNASLVSRFPFFAVLGLFGAVCGCGLGFIGSLARNYFPRRKT